MLPRSRRRWARRLSVTWRRSARTIGPFARRMLASWGGSVRPEGPQKRSPPPWASARIWGVGGDGQALTLAISCLLFSPSCCGDPCPPDPNPYMGDHLECGNLAAVYWGGYWGLGLGSQINEGLCLQFKLRHRGMDGGTGLRVG